MKEDGLKDIDNFYTINLNSFYYNNEHTNKQINTEENINSVNYISKNNTEETVWYDACENLKDDNNTQTLTMPKFVSLENDCLYTVELPTSEHWRPEVKVAKKAKVKNL